jgi:hypothetical protein
MNIIEDNTIRPNAPNMVHPKHINFKPKSPYEQYLDFEKKMYAKYPREQASKILQIAWIEYKRRKDV